jgi:hypothetical protein
MTTAYSTKGKTIGIAVQADLVTPNTSTVTVRTEDNVTIPTEEFLSEPQKNMGRANAYDVADQPIIYEAVRENAISLPVAVRRSPDTTTPTIPTLAESGGCNVDVNDDDTITAYTDTTDWDLTTGLGADKNGQAILVELDNGLYWPTLLADYTHSTTTCTPGMALPSASSATNATKRMYTITPNTGQVDNSKLLTFIAQTRGKYTTAPDLTWQLAGCALGTFGEIKIEPGGEVIITPTFHVADVDKKADTLTAESFTKDTTYRQRNYGNFRFEFADANTSGAIASAHMELLSATFLPNHITAAIPGEGSVDVLNSIQGYMAKMDEHPTVTLELLMDKVYWETFDDSPGQTNKYISFIWPTTSLTTPASGIWIPNAYLSAPPVAEPHASDYIKCTLVYTASSSEYGSTRTNNSTGMAPWYMAIHGQSS